MNIIKYFKNIEKMTNNKNIEELIRSNIDSMYHIDKDKSFDIVRNLYKYIKQLETTSNITILGSFSNHLPKGIIACYQGTVAPYGWAICDGTIVDEYQTPDLRGRFIVGYHSGDSSYNKIGNTGGATEVTITTNQMGSHRHEKSGAHHHKFDRANTTNDNDWNYENGYQQSKTGSGRSTPSHWKHLNGPWFGSHTFNHSHTHLSVGGNKPHNNMPPYYILMYIIKIV